MKRFLIYLLRWQLSTPILAVFTFLLKDYGSTIGAIVANFVGAFLFWWIDKWIFKNDEQKY